MYKIFTDMSSDLTEQEVKALGLGLIPIYTIIDRGNAMEQYPEESGFNLSADDFYNAQMFWSASTSCATAAAIMSLLEPELKKGNDILYIGITPEMSSGMENVWARVRRELAKKYPQRRVEAPATHSISGGLGLLVSEVAWQCRRKSLSFDEAVALVDDLARKTAHWFTVDSYDQLRRSGRVSVFGGTIGTMFNLKPLMRLPYDGKMEAVKVVRGGKRLLEEMVSRAGATALDVEGNFWVYYGGKEQLERAQELGALLAEWFPKACISYHRIGPVVGTHTGRTVLALFYFAAER